MTKPIDPDFLKYLDKSISRSAESVRENAAMAGSQSDNGAQNMIDNLTLYLLGVKQEIPDRYSLIYKEFLRNNIIKDREVEYDRYLELKKIFE